MKTLDVVKGIILSKKGDVEISEETSLEDLGLSSLDLVEIALEIEDKFNIEFTSNDILNLTTVRSVKDFIEKKRK